MKDITGMAEHEVRAEKRREHLISLNKIEVALGCGVAVISLVSAFGSWYVLPYRVSQVEAEQKSAASKLETSQRDTQQKMETMQRSAESTKELLIRIDERLKQVQTALKIPPNQP